MSCEAGSKVVSWQAHHTAQGLCSSEVPIANVIAYELYNALCTQLAMLEAQARLCTQHLHLRR